MSPSHAPPDPFYCTAGPRVGPALARDDWPALGVVADPAKPLPIGIAYGAGWRPDPGDPERPAWALFRLVVGKVELPGRWAPVGRQFVRVGG